ncbi:MAG: hypothetical protein GYA55_01000 [SAR324 cluster bacterium]|uniref:Uncharacterized protein n=1 Tax=SAR324 cluster bacterium TaxID=2024889 RepID=A0A7X9II64_9DELT|nr:hypothetical protein [SAR324 cluster bacterium]
MEPVREVIFKACKNKLNGILNLPSDEYELLKPPSREALQELKSQAKVEKKGLKNLDSDGLLEYLMEDKLDDLVLKSVISLIEIEGRSRPDFVSGFKYSGPAIVNNIRNKIENGRPLSFLTSLCLIKTDFVRDSKIRWAINGEKATRFSERVYEGLQLSPRIRKIRALREILEYPIEIIAYIGDMDLFSIDMGSEWGSSMNLERTREEVEKLRLDAERKLGLPVLLWSSEYTLDDFYLALSQARKPENWIEKEKLWKDSQTMYMTEWKYEKLARRYSIPEEDIRRFVLDDVIRTAAQYSLEASIAVSSGQITAWTERVPNPSWPIRIANYNGQQNAPSILIN